MSEAVADTDTVSEGFDPSAWKRVGGFDFSTRAVTDSVLAYNPAAPDAGSRCPMFVFTEPTIIGDEAL